MPEGPALPSVRLLLEENPPSFRRAGLALHKGEKDSSVGALCCCVN